MLFYCVFCFFCSVRPDTDLFVPSIPTPRGLSQRDVYVFGRTAFFPLGSHFTVCLPMIIVFGVKVLRETGDASGGAASIVLLDAVLKVSASVSNCRVLCAL